MLPLWWEHSFEGSDPPKIGSETDSERQRREKTQKIGSGTVSGRTFSAAGPFLVYFLGPAGSQKWLKTGILTSGRGPRSATFRRSCSKCLLKPLRAQKDAENHRKVIENCPEIDRTSTAPSVTVCLQNAGGLCQKSSINSEDATPPAGQSFLGCGGLALASSLNSCLGSTRRYQLEF